MRRYVHPSDTSTTTVVLAAFLVAAPYVHKKGSFGHGRSARSLRANTQKLLARSPALCASDVHLHIVHDLNGTLEPVAGATFHHFASRTDVVAGDARWSHFDELLRGLAWQCAFAIDLTDLFVLKLPVCARLNADTLYVSSDNFPAAKISLWLHSRAVRTGLNRSWVGERAYLSDAFHNTSRLVYNCGIVGGTRGGAFERLLSFVARRFREHWSTAPPLLAGGDMVLWNEAALEPGLRVETGYPFGPVNFPMWGALVGQHRRVGAITHTDPRSGGRRACVGRCRHEWVNATRGLFWFGHKTPSSWLRLSTGLERATCWENAKKQPGVS